MEPFPNLFCPGCEAFLHPEKSLCSLQCERPEQQSFPAAGEALWQARVKGAIHAVLVLGELLIVNHGDRGERGGVSAFQRASGALVWTFSTEYAVEGGVAERGGWLYFASIGFMGKGAKLVCLKLDGSLGWELDLPAGCWSLPVVDEARVYVGLDNGQVISVDSRRGELIPQQPVQLPKGNVWLMRVDESMLVALSSKSGQIVALSPLGLRPLWTAVSQANCEISSRPCLVRGQLFFGSRDGGLFALRLRDGEIHQMGAGMKGVIATPVFSQNRLWVGAQDRKLHLFDIETGQECSRDLPSFEHAISSAPFVNDEFVAVSVNDAGLVLLDGQTCEPIWSSKVEKDARLYTQPVILDGMVFIGTNRGGLFALPWHLGQVEKAAEHLRRHAHWHLAGLYYALAAQQAKSGAQREAHYQMAEECWNSNATPEWAARMWEGLAYEMKAGDAYYRAGENQRGANRKLAADYYYRASRLYWRADPNSGKHSEAEQQAAKIGRWPLIRLEKRGNPRMVQGSPGLITFRAWNVGYAPARNLYFALGSSLAQPVTCQVAGPLAPDSYFEISLPIIQTRPSDELLIEVEYKGEEERTIPFTGRLVFAVEAAAAAHKIKMGNSAFGKIKIVNPDNQPIDFEMGDSVSAEVVVDFSGDPGEPRRCPNCQTEVTEDAKICDECGARL